MRKTNECFFVNLNEMSKKEMEGAEGKMKGFITDATFMINQKCVFQFSIKYFPFLISNNKEDPFATKKGDQRNLIQYRKK